MDRGRRSANSYSYDRLAFGTVDFATFVCISSVQSACVLIADAISSKFAGCLAMFFVRPRNERGFSPSFVALLPHSLAFRHRTMGTIWYFAFHIHDVYPSHVTVRYLCSHCQMINCACISSDISIPSRSNVWRDQISHNYWLHCAQRLKFYPFIENNRIL